MNLGVDLSRGPTRYACLRSATVFAERAVFAFRYFGPALILPQRVQPDLLFIVEKVVEFMQRRLDCSDSCDHRLDPRLHGGEPRGRRQRDLGRTCRLDVLGGFHRGVGEIV